MDRKLILNQNHWQEMLEHVQQHVPLEACGLLAGINDRVEKVIPVRNQAQSPARFVMDPYEQLQAFDWIESNGLELLGIFHSHPNGPETVSRTDVEESAYEVIHLILSQTGGGWRARGFWIESGSASEVPVQITE